VKEPPPTHGPAPSIWPVTLAAGVGIAAVGALTSPIVVAAGVFMIVAALVGWIRQALEEVAP
jgi:hypothetical protein